ncbi:unnamed protein product, partial [Brassica rapa subsp. narinosa]
AFLRAVVKRVLWFCLCWLWALNRLLIPVGFTLGVSISEHMESTQASIWIFVGG